MKIRFLDYVWDNRIKLAVSIYVAFLVVYTILSIFDLIPKSFEAKPVIIKDQVIEEKIVEVKEPEIIGADPIRIIIKDIGVDTTVSNPATSSIAVLDEYLRKGAVRYPGSAQLGKGNVFLFGHSSGLRVINNQAYKAFNNFKLLKGGEEIVVYSLDKEYIYEVESVKLSNAEDAFVDFSIKKNMLTLSTCNTFGQKEERYVVEAVFKEVKPIVTESI
jgi:LPXTG-site transpeptidase (sortase) family protein